MIYDGSAIIETLEGVSVKGFASFAELRRSVMQIYTVGNGAAVWLKPYDYDAIYETSPMSNAGLFVTGDGSRNNPYRYLGGVPVSPHYAVLDLWLCIKRMYPGFYGFIQAGNWLLMMTPRGVMAEDGRETAFFTED